jgi:glycosyltransferase involved in cell wall biosynthesis
MSTGCLVVGSDTAPVTEIIQDGENGLLVDFFSPKKIADRIDEVLEHPTRLAQIRANARKTVQERYALADLLPQQLQLIKTLPQSLSPNL